MNRWSTTGRRGRATSYLDRTWLGRWTVLGLAPVQPPEISELRAKLVEFMAAESDHPLCCSLSADGRRWLPVAPEDRVAHAASVIVPDGSIDVADPFAYLDVHRPDPTSRAPFKIVVGPDSLAFYFAHVSGDAAVFSPFSVLMARGDVEDLEHLRSDAGLALALRIFGREARTHWRDWWQHVRGSGGEDRPTPVAGRTPVRAVHTPCTVAVGTVVDVEQYKAFTAWRKANRQGVSATALMASATYSALAAEGLPIDATRFFTLVDLRRHLPKEQAMRPGNLAKGTFVVADMTDPEAVGAALKQMVGSSRAVAAMMSGAVGAVLGRTTPEPAEHSDTVTLTFNSMMQLPGVERIPWTDPGKAQYITMSYPVSADGISVSACAIGGRLWLSASFDPSALDPSAVQRALNRLQDMPAVLEHQLPTDQAADSVSSSSR